MLPNGYTLKQKLRADGLGNRVLAVRETDNNEALVRLVDVSGYVNRHVLQKEVATLGERLHSIRHPNFLPIQTLAWTDVTTVAIAYNNPSYMSLAECIRTYGPLDDREAAILLRDLVMALRYAVRHGVMHLALRPECIYLRPVDDDDHEDFPYTPVIGDLGVAALELHLLRGLDPEQRKLRLNYPLTMAPEQFSSPGDIDRRTDIYGLGCVYAFALLGRHVFDADTLEEIKERKASINRRVLWMMGIKSPESRKAIARMIQPRMESRPSKHSKVLTMLQGVLRANPGAAEQRHEIFAGNVRLAAIGTALLLAAGIIFTAFLSLNGVVS